MSKSLFGSIFGLCALFSLPLAAAPVVTVGNPIVSFNYVTGGPVPAPQSVGVAATEVTQITGATVTYVSGGSPGWLNVFPPGAQTTPALLTFVANPVALTAGSYIAQVQVQASPVDPASSLTVTVFLVVNGGNVGVPTQTITADQTSLDFQWSAGSLLPTPQLIQVKVSDDAGFTATRVTDAGGQWLNVAPTTSESPGTILVTVDPANLSSGTYTGTVTLTAPFAVVQVPVTLTVSGLGFDANPGEINLGVPQNYGVSAYQPIRITSPGELSFETSVTSDANWLQVDLPGGKTPATIQVRANASSLAQGNYEGTVTIRSGSLAALDIPVHLIIGPPAVVGIQPAGLSFNWTIGDPAPAVQTSRVNSLSATAQNFVIDFSSFDGGTWLNATANQLTTPAIITVQAVPGNLTPGTYTGIVNVTPSITNAAPQPIQVSLTVKAPPPPAIQSVNNSASYVALGVSPGQFVTLFGSNIGPKDLVVAPKGTLPRNLGNTIVSFDAIPAPILYASSTQTSVQVPYGVTPNVQTNIVVTYNNLNSSGTKVNVLPAYPGLFTADASGRGPAAALNADLSLNTPSNAASRGTAVVLYGTGEGRTSPTSIEGAITPVVAPIPATQLPVTVSIGGFNAQLTYVGETPGIVSGLFQINAIIPSNAPTGSNIPVVVTINGVPSQSGVTISIK